MRCLLFSLTIPLAEALGGKKRAWYSRGRRCYELIILTRGVCWRDETNKSPRDLQYFIVKRNRESCSSMSSLSSFFIRHPKTPPLISSVSLLCIWKFSASVGFVQLVLFYRGPCLLYMKRSNVGCLSTVLFATFSALGAWHFGEHALVFGVLV